MLQSDQAGTSAAPLKGGFAQYFALARLDHSTKHVFIVPGIALAALLRGVEPHSLFKSLVLGFLTALCIASANYVINEWLDREFDKHHPTKSRRSAVQWELKGRVVFCEWLLLIAAGLCAASFQSLTMLCVAGLFALQGVAYNVQPWRTKDKPYLDVLSESVNNPLRLLIGWAIIDPLTLPPSSIILCYWFGGAFLMAAKRLSEYRHIVESHGKDLLVRYRASFRGYTEATLTVSCFVYAMLSSFFLATFLIKYRVEYLLVMPVIITLFAYYLTLALGAGSVAERPETLFRERRLIVLVGLLVLVSIVTTLVDIPRLSVLTNQKYISLK